MNHYDSSIARLTAATEADNKALADIALFELTELVLKTGDELSAVSYVDRLAEEYPESYYLPYGLKIKADILFGSKDTIDEAKLIYRQLLEAFPNYPFINGIRQKMRAVETESAPS
jgi:tetratricopeptide (TPR) repeat protein